MEFEGSFQSFRLFAAWPRRKLQKVADFTAKATVPKLASSAAYSAHTAHTANAANAAGAADAAISVTSAAQAW